MLRSYFIPATQERARSKNTKKKSTNIKQMERNKFNTINFYRILKCARDSCKALPMTHSHRRPETTKKEARGKSNTSAPKNGQMKKVTKSKINESATWTQQLVLIRLDLAYSARHIFSSTSPFSYFRALWPFGEASCECVYMCSCVYLFICLCALSTVASHHIAGRYRNPI